MAQQAPLVSPAQVYSYVPPKGGIVASPPVTKQPWSRGKKIAVVSIIFGAITLIFAPYIFGIISIILGVYALKDKSRRGIAGILLALIGIATNFLYIFVA